MTTKIARQLPWAILFFCLNLLEVYSTKVSLSAGAVELNPIASANYLVRGLLAIFVVFALILVGKRHWLFPLSLLVLVVVLWNLSQYIIAQ
jgi:hypothetical protein